MKTLTIKDLSITEELDSKAMGAVRGGFEYGFVPSPSYYKFSSYYAPDDSTKINAHQLINNNLNFQNANGNNVALAYDIKTNQDPHIVSNNNIYA